MPISPLATRPPSLNLIDEFSNMLVNEQKVPCRGGGTPGRSDQCHSSTPRCRTSTTTGSSRTTCDRACSGGLSKSYRTSMRPSRLCSWPPPSSIGQRLATAVITARLTPVDHRFFRLGGCHKALWALLAGTSIFIASKYYQISAVRVRLITEALHNTYTRQDVYDMEVGGLTTRMTAAA